MLTTMWGKGYPYSLLVGVQTSTTIMEINMEASQEIKSRTALSSHSTPEHIPKGSISCYRDTCTHTCLLLPYS